MVTSWLRRRVDSTRVESSGPPVRSLIAIRCTGYSGRLAELHLQLSTALPDLPIVIVADERSHRDVWPAGYDVVAVTDEKLDGLGLFRERENVGWACGDYCYYALLERNWDFLWLVEPDVSFVGGSEYELGGFDASDADLIGTRIGARGPNWPWRSRLERVHEGVDVKGVFFPLTRVSRDLAEHLHEVRRGQRELLQADRSLAVPNDESVTASFALGSGYSVLDLKVERSELFNYWNWAVRFPVDDMSRAGIEKSIIHPALSSDEFRAFIDDETHRVVTSSARASERLAPSLSFASAETRAYATAAYSEVLSSLLGSDTDTGNK